MPTPLNIILLTHERECDRPTNTGKIALTLAPNTVERVIWHRTAPNPHLLALLASNQAALLYPTSETESTDINNLRHIIILDATWQEAQKMYNQSPYLKAAPKAAFSNIHSSRFALRRNQPEGGLCTIECIIELCKQRDMNTLAGDLEKAFELFNRRGN